MTVATREAFSFTLKASAGDVAQDGSWKFSGIAAVYDATSDPRSDPMGTYSLQIARGAFRNVVGGDVRFLINHDPNRLLARTTNGTLRVAEKAKGLGVEADVGAYSYAADLRTALKRGDITQMSFAVAGIRDEWSELENGMQLRRLMAFDQLDDVSVVTFPQWQQTEAAAFARPPAPAAAPRADAALDTRKYAARSTLRRARREAV